MWAVHEVLYAEVELIADNALASLVLSMNRHKKLETIPEMRLFIDAALDGLTEYLFQLATFKDTQVES